MGSLEALHGIDGLLLDMDGVLIVSLRPVPGAVAAIARLRRAGLPLRVLTSTTSHARAQLGTALRVAGFELRDEEILTAVGSAAAWLRVTRPDARVACLGDAPRDDLDDVELVGLHEAPDIVLLSGADRSYTFEALNGVCRAVLDGAELVSMHRNLLWMTDEGMCLDAGAYLLGIERALGRRATVTGKPAADFYAAGLAMLGLPAGRVAMVGDDVDNDVLAAQRLGIAGVLVRTGKYRPEALAAADGTPDRVIDSIADVPRLLGIGG